MLNLQNTISYQGNIDKSPFSQVQLTFIFPVFNYIPSNSTIRMYAIDRKIVTTDYLEVSHALSDSSYHIAVPVSDLIGSNEETITNFVRFTTNYFGVESTSIDRLSFTIQVQITVNLKLIGSSELQALYVMKSPVTPLESTGTLSQRNIPLLDLLEKNIFLINKETYERILPLFKRITDRSGDILLLSVIQKFIIFSNIDPRSNIEINEFILGALKEALSSEGIGNSDEVARLISAHLNDLFNFPIVIPEIKILDISGTFEVKTPNSTEITKNDLLFYDLSVEYTSDNYASPLSTFRYDWNDNDNQINDNRISFKFSDVEKIVLGDMSGLISISVKAFDGTVLWRKDFTANDPALKTLDIVVSQLSPVILKSAQASVNSPNAGKKLRGQVLELTKKCSLKDLTIIIQTQKAGDEIWRVVAASKTDASGNFSMSYPYGEYTKAQAIVSLTPNTPADIPIKHANSNESIADDFLYLLVTNPECPELSDKEDCDCTTPKKASRLPDHADLIGSDEYSQDIGGSCVNLSTPNRTLNEFRYSGIVRTSDPDVANYTLTKNDNGTFDLTGNQQIIKRAAVNIDNPIRWQDAPDSGNNLTFYQAVSVATGHVLHYRAEFKADGYSLGDLLYSLALAPGQKKQIVVIDSAHSLEGSADQNSTQTERLAANLIDERDITNALGGRLNESTRGSSSANTGGISAGGGLAGTGKSLSGVIGVSGGYASSNSSASQNSSRDTGMFFGEKLRQSHMQNAESYRQANSTVVTSVKEGQQYSVTTDVVANHNHCHAMTMMYFEVLRHYAIFQEMVSVEECIFVPLLMTNFSTENIYKWADVIAKNLLSMPSNTYLQPASFSRNRFQHPLLPAFDANARKKTNYLNVDFPAGAFCDEVITSVTGSATIRVNIPRPKTIYDRIMSFPIVKKESTTNRNGGGFWGSIVDAVVGKRFETKTWEEKVKFTDEHIVIYDNFQEARPADVIEVIKFSGFFEASSKDGLLWNAIADLCGYSNVEEFLANYFSHKTISQWDATFNAEIAPKVFAALVNNNTISISPFSAIDFTANSKYNGGDRLISMNFRCNTSLARKDITEIKVSYFKTVLNASEFWSSSFATLSLQNLAIYYSTKHYEGNILNKYINDDLQDDTVAAPLVIPAPMNTYEQRDPHKEDDYLVLKLIEHLNSNLEHYNKVLWYNLDPDRRYTLLDGFTIQVYNDFGMPTFKRSLASVVKNELLTVAGNSLVFPVAAGYKVSNSYISERNQDGQAENVSLLDHYKPYTPIPPYRISVPSRGVFLEAVQGQCGACEKVEENTSQDWAKFTTDEPTSVLPVTTPVPTITDWKAAFKEFAPPLINIQNTPAMPAPGAGLGGLQELLGKSGVFKDITGLDANQQNVMKTYLSNQENARAFGEMAKSMAMQEHNSKNSDKIMDSLKEAKDSGAISKDEYGKLVKDHIQKQIDGGEAQNRQAEQDNKKKEASPIDSAVELAKTGNSDVSATESDSKGNTKSLDVKVKGGANLKYNFTVPGAIRPIKQQTPNACWATVATMMSNWKKQNQQSVDDYVNSVGEEYVPYIQDGIPVSKLDDFCKIEGLRASSPNAEYPVSFYYDILQKNGPIWVVDLESADPKMLHGRLLIGIKGDDSSATTVFTIVDPMMGSKYDEDLPTFVRKTENAVKSLDAVKDAQIPLLIYYKSSYDKSLFSGKEGGSAVIGAGTNTSNNPQKLAFPSFTGRVDDESRSILDAMMPAPAGTMMREIVDFAKSELSSGKLTGIMLSSHVNKLQPLLAPGEGLPKTDANGHLAAGIFAARYSSPNGKGYILINKKEFDGQASATVRYALPNKEWRAALAHELQHQKNIEEEKFLSDWTPTDVFLVDVDKAVEMARSKNESVWSVSRQVTGELAGRFVNWFIWEEIVLGWGTPVTLPTAQSFFRRAYDEVVSFRDNANYDASGYIKYLLEQDKDGGNRLPRQVAIWLGHTAHKYYLFDDHLNPALKGKDLFLSAKAAFEADPVTWKSAPLTGGLH
jgi:Papain-like cysteine protease AvrRpt2